MIESKKINIIVAVAVCFALITGIFVMGFSSTVDSSDDTVKSVSESAYAEEIFGVDIISLEIITDKTDWQTMLDNAQAEEFIMADVVVNGTKFSNVGIRPKGNSSLQKVTQYDSDRYSFRLKFNEYIKDQTCFGLESFVVNNAISDNSYMREYISYDIMNTAGVDSPYFGFTNITVNGDAWGLYLAVEVYDDNYEERVFGDTSGMLYSVKGTEIADNNVVPDQQAGLPTRGLALGDTAVDDSKGEVVTTDTRNIAAKTKVAGRVGMDSSGGGTLQYTDDNSSSYSSIFGNVVGTGTETDYQRVITALEALSTGSDLEEYFDVDEILRYFAAHTVVVNLDSYSSRMAQNYYIIERDGVISILPWDYNEAWGALQNTDMSFVINFAIDTPVSGVEMSERPLLEKLFSNSEYLETYHQYLQEILDNYFSDGQFEDKINELNSLISDYVKNDQTAFCTYEEYHKAVTSFTTLGNLRAESIEGQLNGTIPSTTALQATSPESLIGADNLMLSDLGTMIGENTNKGTQIISSSDDTANAKNGNTPGQPLNGDMPDRAVMQLAIQILQAAGGTITDGVKAELAGLGLTQAQIEMLADMPAGGQGGNRPGNMPQGGNQPAVNQNNQASTNASTQQAISTNMVNILMVSGFIFILVGATIFVAKMKRRY